MESLPRDPGCIMTLSCYGLRVVNPFHQWQPGFVERATLCLKHAGITVGGRYDSTGLPLVWEVGNVLQVFTMDRSSRLPKVLL
jgi:hypothetical protein